MFELIPFLFQSGPPTCTTGTISTVCACTFGGLNQNAWININTLVVTMVIVIGGFIYAMASLFPTLWRERLRGAARYEMIQAIVSIIIILILVAFALFTCQLGQQMTMSVVGYQNPMQYSQIYLSQLLFQKSTALFTEIYSESVALTFWGNVMDELETVFNNFASTPFVGFELGASLVGIFFGFSSTLTTTYSALIAVTFGVVFIYYALLPLIATLALTVMVPVSLVMRSIPFAGPRLREASDSFLALAIAMYFIFPLTILFDNLMINWMYAQCLSPSDMFCNPNYNFLTPYSLNNLPISSMFASSTVHVGGPFNVGIPLTFFGGALGGLGGGFNAINQGLSTLATLPSVMVRFAGDLAQYLFETIVLLALDTAITIGFATGLAKALGSISRLMAVGPVWSA
ncbi:MAG: hypothetical protein KGH72_01815 [Candidatus Micrarchaeota archaeon]|nr:hypothetical protein [Candidatus Micrarchaeota archaeon]